MEYLADFVVNDSRNVDVRPNQVIACSLDYSPLNPEMKKNVLDVVKSELLTNKGLRTLSPKNELYKGIYKGNQEIRDSIAHQGSVYPWLLEHFVYGYLSVHKKSGLSLVKILYSGFEEDMTEYGIATISELYDGNPPHDPKGAISYSGSVASLLRIGEIIEKY
jgi:glycogen debranching enzyme